jgi:hypothetical protein
VFEREREGDEACCFCCGNTEQAQGGLGEPVDRGLRDAVGVALVQPQRPEQVSGDGSQRKLRAGDSKEHATVRPGHSPVYPLFASF